MGDHHDGLACENLASGSSRGQIQRSCETIPTDMVNERKQHQTPKNKDNVPQLKPTSSKNTVAKFINKIFKGKKCYISLKK